MSFKDHIVRELNRKGIKFTTTGYDTTEKLVMLCPFHKENTPSFFIKAKSGYARCYGCQWSGSWNDFAHKLGLTGLDGPSEQQYGENELYDLDKYIRGVQEAQQNSENRLPAGCDVWTYGDYRGISQTLLSSIPTYRWWDDSQKCYRILWPVNVNGELQGWIARRLDTEKIKKYYNMPNKLETNWASQVVFPIDLIHTSTVFFMEGPVNALYMLNHEIPSLAFMGGAWSPKKISLLLAWSINQLIFLPDNDESGGRYIKKIFEECKNLFVCKILKLPNVLKDINDLEKPSNAGIKDQVLGKLKDYYEKST